MKIAQLLRKTTCHARSIAKHTDKLGTVKNRKFRKHQRTKAFCLGKIVGKLPHLGFGPIFTEG